MKFYNRENEIRLLKKIQQRSMQNAQFTVLTGRRRIGKTHLLLNIEKTTPVLYFFVARKSESFLCQDFQVEIEQKLDLKIFGEPGSFGKLFEFLIIHSKKEAFTLIIDEFQEFFQVAPYVYSEIQPYWDIHKEKSKINLIVSGSVSSLIHKIFENSKEPLFGRATSQINIKPFEVSVIKEILTDHYPDWTNEDLLAIFAFSGGVPKYIQMFMDAGTFSKGAMIDLMIADNSLFIAEGKNILVEEFGKEYANYFTILSAIARGENTRARIEAILKREVGGYLTKLYRDYNLITKTTPIFSKVETKNVKYSISDNFLTFWFRFIYKYSHIIEIGAYEELKEIISRDYNTFSGLILERYFRSKIIEEKGITNIGAYWDRKGETEIDLIAVNQLKQSAEIIEIKRNPHNINLGRLKQKGFNFMNKTGELKNYKIKFKGLSMEDM